MTTLLYLVGGLVLILFFAEVFTNGVEWLGKKLNLSEGAVGSVLAAVGTALPESLIPVIAVFFGTGEASHEIGIGAILGAPFMLATLALSITGIAALLCKVNGKHRVCMLIDNSVLKRDLGFFLVLYSLAVAASLLPASLKVPAALLLVVAYIYYVSQTLKGNNGEDSDLAPLHFARRTIDPSIYPVIAQVVVSLAGIIAGAHLFVTGITEAANILNISPFILAIFIAPVATELPEKVNSILWVRKGKDTLAMGNITGAMVFQSSIIPAFGIAFTPWVLSDIAVISVLLALAGAAITYITLKVKEVLRPAVLVLNGSLYLVFVLAVIINKA